MSAPESPEFARAIVEVKQFTKKPSNDDLLRLYALFKISKGFEFNPADEPGRFSFEARAKWKAWESAYKDDDITEPAQAQLEYVKLVEELKVKYDFDPNKTPE
ncbi:Triakontatetraneuropeptide [Dactylellina cionopaga]|nr:Triakontatetraneuropeptide [Dactylellina cionopaga]